MSAHGLWLGKHCCLLREHQGPARYFLLDNGPRIKRNMQGARCAYKVQQLTPSCSLPTPAAVDMIVPGAVNDVLLGKAQRLASGEKPRARHCACGAERPCHRQRGQRGEAQRGYGRVKRVAAWWQDLASLTCIGIQGQRWIANDRQGCNVPMNSNCCTHSRSRRRPGPSRGRRRRCRGSPRARAAARC